MQNSSTIEPCSLCRIAALYQPFSQHFERIRRLLPDKHLHSFKKVRSHIFIEILACWGTSGRQLIRASLFFHGWVQSRRAGTRWRLLVILLSRLLRLDVGWGRIRGGLRPHGRWIRMTVLSIGVSLVLLLLIMLIISTLIVLVCRVVVRRRMLRLMIGVVFSRTFLTRGVLLWGTSVMLLLLLVLGWTRFRWLWVLAWPMVLLVTLCVQE